MRRGDEEELKVRKKARTASVRQIMRAMIEQEMRRNVLGGIQRILG